MKMFNDLRNFEAVKVDDKLCVQLANGDYLVDGVPFTVTSLSEQHILNINVQVEKKVVIRPQITHYKNSDGLTISMKDYHATINNNFGKYYCEEDDDYAFPDLDTEYNYKKFLAAHTAMWSKENYVHRPVDIIIKGEWIDTGSDFIETPYSQGHTTFNGGVYKVLTSNIAWDEFRKQCNKYNLTYDGDDLRFVKVNKDYIFASRFDHIPYIKSNTAFTVTKSLDDAYKCEEDVRVTIRKRMFVLFGEQSIDGILRKQIHNDLSYALDKIRSLEVKVKANTDKSNIIHKIANILVSLEKNL